MVHYVAFRKCLAVLCGLALTATVLWASGDEEGGDAAASAGKTVIRFDSWMWGESDFKAPVQSVVDEYMRLNPTIDVRMEASGWAETRNKLMTRAAAGDSVDVMMLDSDWPYQLGIAGALADLNQLAPQDYLADNYQASLQTNTVDGKLFAVPNAVNSHGWWTNRGLLERNGLTVPVTWDDVYANAVKLKENDIYGMHNWQMCGDNLGMVLWSFWNFGVFPMSPEALANEETGFDSPELHAMYGFMRKMAEIDAFAATCGDGRQSLYFEEVPYLTDSGNTLPLGRNTNPDLLGGDKIFDVFSVERFPVVEAGMDPVIPVIDHTLAIWAGSQVKEESWALVQYFAGSEYAAENYVRMTGSIVPPQTLAQKRLDNEYNNDIHRGFLENSYPFLQVMPYNPNWHATGKLIIDSWQASVLTDEPIEDIIKTAEKGLQSVLF